MMTTARRREEQHADAERRAAADRQHEQDRQARNVAAAAQARRDADRQRQVKSGEDLENAEARKAELTPPQGMNCTTVTESSQSDNA